MCSSYHQAEEIPVGETFTLKIDHWALVTLLSQSKIKRTMSRVKRWREKLVCFDYKVVFHKSEENEISYCISQRSTEIRHSEITLKEGLVISV